MPFQDLLPSIASDKEYATPDPTLDVFAKSGSETPA